jgi:hypothetical protein
MAMMESNTFWKEIAGLSEAAHNDFVPASSLQDFHPIVPILDPPFQSSWKHIDQ